MHDEVDLSDAWLFCSDGYGIYIPKMFADEFPFEVLNLPETLRADYLILKAGPEHEWYWDAWQLIQDNATLEETLKDGTKRMVRPYQDGDLWMIPVDLGPFVEEVK